MPSLNLRFFDAAAGVECQREDVRAALALLYRDARVAERPPDAVGYRIGAGVECLEPGSEVQTHLAGPPVRGVLAHALFFSSLAARVRSHWLLHAAALSTPTGGMLLVGGSGSGKSTLALALAQRGYGWLSDEVAAVERASGRLSPFPRGALLRPGTLGLVPEARSRAVPWPLADDDAVACWHPRAAGDPTAVRWVFLLRGPASDGPVRVAVSHLTEGLRDRLRAEPELEAGAPSPRCGCVVVEWPGPLSSAGVRLFAAACKEEGVVLLNLYSVVREARFSGPARLEPCAPSAAWLEMAAAAWNRPSDGASAVPGFLRELAAFLAAAECCELSVGPLPETAAVVEDVCGRGCLAAGLGA